MQKIILMLAVLSLGGCASEPISNEQAKPVPANQILNHDLFAEKANTGVVIIKRDYGYVGIACLTRVYVDGQEVADLARGEKITIHPDQGAHIFSAKPNGMCGGGTVEQSGNVVEGKVLTYRIGHGSDAELGLYPTAF